MMRRRIARDFRFVERVRCWGQYFLPREEEFPAQSASPPLEVEGSIAIPLIENSSRQIRLTPNSAVKSQKSRWTQSNPHNQLEWALGLPETACRSSPHRARQVRGRCSDATAKRARALRSSSTPLAKTLLQPSLLRMAFKWVPSIIFFLTGQKLKVIRHPSIVKFQWEQRTSSLLSMITEPLEPVLSELPHMSASEVSLGLHSIAEGFAFLHTKVWLVLGS